MVTVCLRTRVQTRGDCGEVVKTPVKRHARKHDVRVVAITAPEAPYYRVIRDSKITPQNDVMITLPSDLVDRSRRYVSNLSLHNDLKITTTTELAKTMYLYKRFHQLSSTHSNSYSYHKCLYLRST